MTLIPDQKCMNCPGNLLNNKLTNIPGKLKIEDLEVGKIYHVSFGKNNQVLCRFKELSITDIKFFDHLHYWNGFENFHVGGYCVLHGIEELRNATPAEKMALVRFEIERDCI